MQAHGLGFNGRVTLFIPRPFSKKALHGEVNGMEIGSIFPENLGHELSKDLYYIIIDNPILRSVSSIVYLYRMVAFARGEVVGSICQPPR